mmetsp:Transcript_126226/g.363054  ORF Transcript_126226/g.363054 Transcript_126226/m.363054 type:complete len:1232 (+) Transcript_126226:152-3847(+)
MPRQVWEVVGGKKDGLLVRTGRGLKSPEADGRLNFGSLVEELELEGDRLQYRRLTGSGPETGWVSLKLKGADLLVRSDKHPPGSSLDFVPAARTSATDSLQSLPALPRGGWRVLHAASSLADDSRTLHVCCLTVCEAGHMLPTLRIARALAHRSAVKKVTIVTNVYGARKLIAWLADDADTSGRLELVEFEDGWDQAAQDRSNQFAQEEDGTYFNQCNHGMGENAFACLKALAFGDDRPCCFLVDYATFGMIEALKVLKAPQTVVRSIPLSILAFLVLSAGAANGFSDGAPTTAESVEASSDKFRNLDLGDDQDEDMKLVHCWELPPMFSAYMPKMPKRAIPVGILVDEGKTSVWPATVREFVEKPGPPVLYVSMGSVARFSNEQLAKVVEALQCSGEWRVLWSLRQAQQDLLPPGGAAALGPDFLVSAWLPQAELLQHPNVAAFMSHCGWGACCEAFASGKPVIAFPMFADQYVNALLLELMGMCKTVDEEPIDMDADAWKRRMARVAGIRTGATEHTRNRFTAAGLKKDIRAVLKGKSYRMRAAAMQEYSKKSGGVQKAADEVERIAKEAALKLATLEQQREWPRAPLERFRAVVVERKDDILAAAKGAVVMQVLISGLSEGACFHVDCYDSKVDVQEGKATSPTITISVASEEALFQTWCGSKDLAPFAVEGNELYARRLFSLLFVRDQDPESVDRRTPLDGVIRPPPGPGGIAQCRADKLGIAPAWLKPDGLPEPKKRLLFVSLPWAGHIVHLKRIAAWFSERPKYEVHFGYFSENPPEVHSSVKLHGAEEGELSRVFDALQAQLKDLGMRVWGDGAKGMELSESIDMEKEPFKFFRFLTRVIFKVKPSVIVTDSGFAIGGFLQAVCQVMRASLILIHSPGIKEKWIAESAAQEEDPAEKMQKLSSDFPEIDIGQVMAGTFDVKTLPEGLQYLLTAPGVELIRLLQVFGAMAAPDPSKAPISLYPSSSWMVEQQADKGEVFTCPLLPLPGQAQGEVQLSEAALAKCLDPDLHSWIFSGSCQDPIVYVAFGTIVQGARPIVDKLAAALDGGKWRVLWSLPQEMHAWLPSGLSKERWCVKAFVPQKDVFRCDRVRCFISHCGANSTIEALSCGVPMVCHPFFLDQYDWARTVRRHLRAGVQVDKFDSGPAAVRLAVTEVLEDPSYRAAAQATSKRLHAQAEQIKTLLGPDMAPKENLGPGVSVAAAIIISLMKGKDPMEVTKLVQATNS